MIQSENYVGQPVRSLQTMLRVIGQGKTGFPTVVPDGIYGKNTESAVRQFQKDNRLPVTGVADNTTWDLLVIEYELALVDQHPAEPLRIVLQPGQVIRAGDWNYHLFLIQAILASLSRIHTDFPGVPVSGVLDPATAKSISHFQSVSGLPVTGEVDKRTWQHLANHYAHMAGDGTSWAAKK